MKPLVILVGSFGIALVITRLINGVYDPALSGRVSMTVMLVFTAIGHFVFTKGMRMMIPSFVPYKTGIVYATGVFEIFAGIALLLTPLQLIAAWALVIFFVLLLPANIYAAMHRIDHEKGTNNGKGLSYLWFRIPLQIVFIVWVYFAGIQ